MSSERRGLIMNRMATGYETRPADAVGERSMTTAHLKKVLGQDAAKTAKAKTPTATSEAAKPKSS